MIKIQVDWGGNVTEYEIPNSGMCELEELIAQDINDEVTPAETVASLAMDSAELLHALQRFTSRI